MADAWAVVVARHGPVAKTRLAEVLDPHARSALALAMLRDVIDATLHAGLAGTIAVLDRPAPAILTEGPAILPGGPVGRIQVVADPESGLDRAVEAGVRAAIDAGAEIVLVLPGDIPLVTHGDLQKLLRLARSATRTVVVATDRHGTGTNALALRPPGVVAPSFGPGSAERHLAAAVTAGAVAQRVDLAGISLDIDTPADLAELVRRSPGGATAAALAHVPA
jgi:2-phospho-L-lactate guanylyltransferase